MEQALRTYLTTHEDVSAVFATRVYPLIIPVENNGVYPALTYQRIDTARDYSHSGESGIRTARFQVTVWAKSYFEAKRHSATLTQALEAWQGTYDEGTVSTVEIDDENDVYSDKLFGLALDIIVEYEV